MGQPPAAAAAAIESMLKFCHILSMGGAAAGANRGVQGTGYNPICLQLFCSFFLYPLIYGIGKLRCPLDLALKTLCSV